MNSSKLNLNYFPLNYEFLKIIYECNIYIEIETPNITPKHTSQIYAAFGMLNYKGSGQTVNQTQNII